MTTLMDHKEILEKYSGSKAGMTVPENFFKDFNSRMAAQLPHQNWESSSRDSEPVVLRRTTWQKIRPYVYLAAMFAGIWCMMKMFDLMKPASRLDIANNPVLLSAIDNDAFYYDYCVPDITDDDLYEDLYEQGVDPAEILPPSE